MIHFHLFSDKIHYVQISFTILVWVFLDTLHLQCFVIVTVSTLCLSRQTCLIMHSSEHHAISLDVFDRSITYIIKNSQDTRHFLHFHIEKTSHFTSKIYLIFCYFQWRHIRLNVDSSPAVAKVHIRLNSPPHALGSGASDVPKWKQSLNFSQWRPPGNFG